MNGCIYKTDFSTTQVKWKVAQGMFVMEAVNILTFVEETKLMDAFSNRQ